MSAAELTRDVQFTVDQHGNITAVVISPTLWQQILEALEDADDRTLVATIRERLREHPAQSGALRWQDVADDWS